MKSYLLEVRDKADLEVKEAFLYYENKSQGLGERFLAQVENCFKRIILNPEQFPRRYRSYREAVVNKFPYVVIYNLRSERIIILSVFNTWKDPKKKPL